MKRFLLGFLFVAIMVSGAHAKNHGQTIKLTFTSPSVPDDAHTRTMTVFKNELELLSNKKITVDVYPNGSLFTQLAEQDAIRKGSVDMVYTAPSWIAEFVPYVSMLSAAYTFQSYSQMTQTLNGAIGKKIFEDTVKATGVRPLAAFYLGTRQLNLSAKFGSVTNPAQMKEVKLRVPNSPSWIAMGRALGASPTPMAFSEVYMGLKTGAIDGQDNPLPTNKNAKFYEVTKYIVLTNHVFDSVWPAMNEKKWQSLTPEQQQWVLAAIEKARNFCDNTNLENEKNILDFFRSKGITIIENPDRAAWASYAKNSYLTESKAISQNWDLKLYDQIQALK